MSVCRAILSLEEFQILRGQLFVILRQLSYGERQVVLSSGERSTFFVDASNTTLTGEGMWLAGRLLLHLIARHAPEVTAIVGPALGACPLVSGVILAGFLADYPLQTGGFARDQPKKYGPRQDLIEGAGSLIDRTPIAVCDDVITSGASLLRAVETARRHSVRVGSSEDTRYYPRWFDVRIALSLVDREEGDGMANVRREVAQVYALYTRTELQSDTLQPYPDA